MLFIHFANVWEQRKFDEVFLSFANKNYQLQSTEYCESGKYPIIDQGKKAIIGYSNDSSKVCENYPSIIFGDHTTELKYVDFPFIIGADGVKTLSVKEGNTLFQYYNLLVNNVRPTGYNRHFSMLKEISVFVPSDVEEQTKIGSYFRNLDNLITLHQRKFETLKKLKKGFLQKMFPQNGESVPEIRFPGFTDAWEQRKVGDLISESKEKGHTGNVSKKLTVKLWGKGVIAKDDKGSSNTQYFIRHKRQFIYSKLDFLNSAFGVIPDELEGFESTIDLPAFDCKDIAPFFLFCTATQPEFYLKNGMSANGSRKAKRINQDVFLNMPINVPSMDEQIKVCNFFKSLDNIITLHQR